MVTVRRSLLGTLDRVGAGASGVVYLTHYHPLTDPTALAYKEYNAGNRRKSGDAVRKVVDFREVQRFRATDLQILDTYFAWPRETVVNDQEVCGFVMRAAPPDYFYWHQGQQKNVLRTLELLATTEKFQRENKIDLSDFTETDRLFLMMQLAYAIAWLHKRGWVFGDLSWKNVAFAERPPRLMLLDCDAATELSDPDREPQLNSPFWGPPECQGNQKHEQDKVTDVYKLGLAIVRCLKPALGASTTNNVNRLADILDADGIQLLTRALSRDRADRPLARELFSYLEQITVPRMVPPEIIDAGLVTPLVLKGLRARIKWTIERAERIQVFLGENPPQLTQDVNPADHPHECTFPVDDSGQVTVVAVNRYGSAAKVIGDIAILEIPPMSVDFDQMPRPDIPRVPPFSVRPFPPSPAYPAGPDIPVIPPLGVAEVLRELTPTGIIVPLDEVIGLLISGSRALAGLLHTETERHVAELRRKLRRRTGWRRRR